MLPKQVWWVFSIPSLPHEAAHWATLKILPWCYDVELQRTVPREQWSHPYMPTTAQVTGSFTEEMPISMIILAASAPFLVFGGISLILGLQLTFDFWTSSNLLVSLSLIYWTKLSTDDIYVILNPREIKEYGEFSSENANSGRKANLVHLVHLFLLFLAVFYLFTT